MTRNQLLYHQNREQERHNRATEKETNRHALVEEGETHRHNVVGEVETNRHNTVSEGTELIKANAAMKTAQANETRADNDTARTVMEAIDVGRQLGTAILALL